MTTGWPCGNHPAITRPGGGAVWERFWPPRINGIYIQIHLKGVLFAKKCNRRPILGPKKGDFPRKESIR